MTKFNATEIFHSIAGEAPRIGNNVVFLRLAKCNLTCDWCLDGNTEIEMADDSLKKIKDIKANEMIKTPYGASKVIKTMSRNVEEIYEIELEDKRKVLCSDNHPFILNSNKIVEAKDLNTSSLLVVKKAKDYVALKVKDIKKIVKNTKVYNLSCNPYAYYIANGILNHNCDSKYSWENGHDISFNDVFEYIKATNANGLSITGGEPLLQQEAIIRFIKDFEARLDLPEHFYLKNLYLKHFYIEIETNGTIKPDDILLYHPRVKFNVSPKLSNSGNKIDKRYNIAALNTFARDDIAHKVILKFVYTGKEGLQEIKEMVYDHNFQKSQVYLMPEGITRDSQLNSQQRVVDVALENGWNFSPRMHVLIWNTKRGV